MNVFVCRNKKIEYYFVGEGIEKVKIRCCFKIIFLEYMEDELEGEEKVVGEIIWDIIVIYLVSKVVRDSNMGKEVIYYICREKKV